MPRVQVDFANIRQTRWYECAIRFFLGGAITVVAGIVAKKFGPAVGGLFLAFPAIFPASVTLIEKHEEERKAQKGLHGEERGRDAAALDAAGAAMGSIGLLVFGLFVWQLLPDHSAPLILIGTALLWFATSCCLWLVREHRRQLFGIRRHAHRAERPMHP